MVLFKHMRSSNTLLDYLKHRLLFAEEVRAQVLDVMQGFVSSPEGQNINLEHTDWDASGGNASFTLRTKSPVKVNDSMNDPSSFRPSIFDVSTDVCPDGSFNVYNIEFFSVNGEAKSREMDFSGQFDPFHDDPSAVASNILLSYQKLVDDSYICARIVEHVWPLIGREPNPSGFSSKCKSMDGEPWSEPNI